MIIINFKNYKSGKEVLVLCRKIEKYLSEAVVAVGDYDIRLVSVKTKLRVFAQHVDYYKTERATGFAIPEIVKRAGAEGSLLNHSEHRLTEETIRRTIKRTNEAGLKIVLCVESVKQAVRLRDLKPWAIAYEDSELVASGRSITQFRQNDIEDFVGVLKGSKILPLCGAGIHTKYDVLAAKQIGCKGVLISSAIAKSRNAEKLLKELKKVYY